MAISEDTVALVAAQLTVAWATRSGVRDPSPVHPHDSEIASMYERFRSLVREVDVTKTPDYKSL